MVRDTPARRARARRDPAIARPPAPPAGDRASTLRNLHIDIGGRPWLIGPRIESDPEMAATADGAATVSINVRDDAGDLQEALSDEAQLLDGAATVTVNGVVYTLGSPSFDDGLVTLPLEDQVAWRLRQFRRFIAVSRSHSTFAQFAKRLVDEASTPPLAPLPFFCPEIDDRQPIAKETSDDAGSPGRSHGTGAGGGYNVKGKRATARQRATLDAILGRADKRGASRRVQIATVMASTQESRMGLEEEPSGKHLGPFNQDDAYGSAAKRRDAASATDGFLDEWKRVHGSVKTARGSLADAIEKVQRSGQGHLYAQWEGEATSTVERWQGADGHSSERTVVEPYEFTRGERHGESEDSWDCIGRYATERAWRRWANLNVLHLVSDDELRAAAPALEIHGDEPWLLAMPGWDWSTNRPVNEIRLRVLADRWGVQIGASVLLAAGGPTRGRFLVAETHGAMVSPEVEVTLHRPAPKKPEPPHTTRTTSSGGTSGAGGGLLDECRRISAQGRSYKYGGGHGKALSAIGPHEALDCSSSVSLALFRADMFTGHTAITSGEFARSWGKPGKGRDFTVWANGEHVWIEFHDAGRDKRFDTSAHGSGESGPRVRRTARNDQARFTARHWAG